MLEKKKSKIANVLILGSADSGKTTLLRQLKILHGSGFSTDEIDSYKLYIFKKIRFNLDALYKGFLTMENYTNDRELFDAIKALGNKVFVKKDFVDETPLSESETQLTRALLNYPAIEQRYTILAREFQLDDTAN